MKKGFERLKTWIFLICRRCFFVIFGPWAPELLVFGLKIGFLVKNCIFCHLGGLFGPLKGFIGGLSPFERGLRGFKGIKGGIVLEVFDVFNCF